MNWLDVVLAAILAGSVLAGLWKGLMRTGIGLASVVVGLLLAAWFYGSAGGFLRDYVSHRAIANFIGFALVFGAVQLLGTLVAWLLDRVFRKAGLKWLDRLLGGVFGLVRGLLLSIVLIMALMAFSYKPPPQSVLHSQLAPYVIEASRLMAALAPREVRDGFRGSYDKIQDAWKKMLRKGIEGLKQQEI